MESDIGDWPILASDLTENYRGLGEIMDVTAEADGLGAVFGNVACRPAGFPLGRQGQELLAHMEPHSAELARKGIHFGRSVDVFSGGVRRLVERLLLVQGFLHSDFSGRIRLEWPVRAGEAMPLPRLVGLENPHSRKIIRRAASLLRGE